MSYEYLYFPLKQEKGPDLSVVTATAGDVDTGKVFVDSTGAEVTGTSTYKADYTALNTLVGQTTAVAEDVAQGKVFVNASGVQTTGTASGGNEGFIKMIERPNYAIVQIPSGVTKIGAKAFSGWENFSGVEIPNTVTQIDEQAFSVITSPTFSSINFPASIESIGGNAFYLCSQLRTVTFLGTPTFIDSTAFKNCTNLTTIRVPWSSGEVSGAPWGATNATIVYDYVPSP